MEIVIGLVVVVVLFLVFGQMSLDKPVKSWSDEELARRLPKYMNVLRTQMLAGAWGKSTETKAKIDEIRSEIVIREQAFQAKQSESLKRESVFEGQESFVTSEEIIADAMDTNEQVRVGRDYSSGSNGKPKDPVKAAVYLLKAAESGHPLATYMVACFYFNGEGLPQNLDSARVWAMKAKSQGSTEVADQVLAAIDAKQNALSAV